MVACPSLRFKRGTTWTLWLESDWPELCPFVTSCKLCDTISSLGWISSSSRLSGEQQDATGRETPGASAVSTRHIQNEPGLVLRNIYLKK